MPVPSCDARPELTQHTHTHTVLPEFAKLSNKTQQKPTNQPTTAASASTDAMLCASCFREYPARSSAASSRCKHRAREVLHAKAAGILDFVWKRLYVFLYALGFFHSLMTGLAVLVALLTPGCASRVMMMMMCSCNTCLQYVSCADRDFPFPFFAPSHIILFFL